MVWPFKFGATGYEKKVRVREANFFLTRQTITKQSNHAEGRTASFVFPSLFLKINMVFFQ